MALTRTPLRRTGPPKRRKGLRRTKWHHSKVWSRAVGKDLLWEFRKLEALIRDAWTCQRCGSKKRLTVHHRLPRSRGGSHALSNLVVLCATDHRLVHDHTAPDWRHYIVSKKHA